MKRLKVGSTDSYHVLRVAYLNAVKRVISLLLPLLLAAFFLAGCSGESSEDSWETFASDTAGFSVKMPEIPARSAERVPTAVGELAMYFYIAEDDTVMYVVAFSDYPTALVETTSAKELLDTAQAGALTNVGGTLLSAKPITLDGYPGREVAIAAPGNLQGYFQLYLVENRLYQLMVIADVTLDIDSGAEKFFTSFEVIGD